MDFCDLILCGSEAGEEVHFEGTGEAAGGGEGEVDVTREGLGDVGARAVHTAGEGGLIKTKLFHASQDCAQKVFQLYLGLSLGRIMA